MYRVYHSCVLRRIIVKQIHALCLKPFSDRAVNSCYNYVNCQPRGIFVYVALEHFQIFKHSASKEPLVLLTCHAHRGVAESGRSHYGRQGESIAHL